MTFQVAAVGADGIVMVSDRLLGDIALSQQDTTYSSTLTSKFLEGNGYIACWSGDDYARVTAWNICKGDIQSEVTETHLEQSAHASAVLIDPTTSPYSERRVIAVRITDLTAWRVDIRSDALGTSRSYTNSILDKCANGDIRNTARFWLNHFLKDRYHSSVTELLFAASYAVIMAGNENPSTIGGIEYRVILRDGSIIRSTPKQENELMSMATELNKVIRRKLFRKVPLSV